MNIQESAAVTRKAIFAVIDARAPAFSARVWPTYLKLAKPETLVHPVNCAKLHAQVRQAAIETGFNYEAATRAAKGIVAAAKTGKIAAEPPGLTEILKGAFNIVIEEDYNRLKKTVLLGELERTLRDLERPIDQYSLLIQKLRAQMDRLAEECGVGMLPLVKQVTEMSGVPEKLVWRVAGGGKRVILDHVNAIARALNRLEAELSSLDVDLNG
jgi:hypothetical protein